MLQRTYLAAYHASTHTRDLRYGIEHTRSERFRTQKHGNADR